MHHSDSVINMWFLSAGLYRFLFASEAATNGGSMNLAGRLYAVTRRRQSGGFSFVKHALVHNIG